MKPRLLSVPLLFALSLSLLGSTLTVTPARAAGIVVNSNADTIAKDGVCTLREAIINANSDNTSGSPDCAAGVGPDTITFASNYTITLVGSQLPAITTAITINGNGVANTIIQANAAAYTATYRVFEVSNTGNLTLDGVTVRNGRCNGSCTANTGSGGGIHNAGTLTVSNATFSGNYADDGGGGIFNFAGSPTITNVTFSGNSATNGGGMLNYGSNPVLTNVTFSGNFANYGSGIYNYGSNNPILTDVTFSGNTAAIGGGMYNEGSNPKLTNVIFSGNSSSYGSGIYNINGNMMLTNGTFSNNSASIEGGGMFNRSASLTLANVTFSGNSATDGGGGMYNDDNSNPVLTNVTFSGNSSLNGGGGMHNVNNSNSTLKNVIIANSTSGGDCVNDASTLNAASINNLIEDAAKACGLIDGDDGNIIGSDPLLGTLTNNGGPTQTLALLPGSPAIDAGNNTICTTSPVSSVDQRGEPRPEGARCDIGAYEVEGGIPVVTATNPSTNAVLASLSSITVVFDQDMLDNASADGAENVNNYLLVERGANAAFDTLSCAGGVVSDDVQQTISAASYNSAGFITTLTLASPLANGTYRLFVCGTTSVWSVAGLELNNGASDYTVNFTIGTGTTGGGTSVETETTASALPKTGFAPNRITTLPPQPAHAEYTALGDLVLEVPSLNVKSTIVGVPQNADDTWDVTWLGDDTGWLNGTAFPTWKGNSVLTAHVTNASGLDGPFAMLKSLQYGDQVIVHMAGAQYIYEVRNTRLVLPYAVNYTFKSLPDHSYLTLITCQGYNMLNESYLFRRVVRAVLVEVK